MNGRHEREFLANEGGMHWQLGFAAGAVEARVGLAPSRERGIANAALLELRAAWAACGTFEWVAFAYLAVSSALIAFLAENLAHPLRLLAAQAGLALVILALCGAEAKIAARSRRVARSEISSCGKGPMAQISRCARNDEVQLTPIGNDRSGFAQKFWHFWRHWYPHLFFLFCFEELGYVMHLVTPNWQDAKLMAFDHWLTGVHPSIWLEQLATPGRNEFMQFVYITYFLYLLALGGILYYRRDWQAYWSVMTYTMAAYSIGYLIAIFFPVESPWFAMAGVWHGELRGGVFTAVINFIEHYGRVRGAAFPSEHVAGSVAALWGAWRHRRWLFWVMVPFAACMCAATVWGRYHYVADVLGGMVTGTLGYVVGKWVVTKWRPHEPKLSEASPH
jgi:membrane-associated phospholipid phosphatase